jgi:hypothetical protein
MDQNQAWAYSSYLTFAVLRPVDLSAWHDFVIPHLLSVLQVKAWRQD